MAFSPKKCSPISLLLFRLVLLCFLFENYILVVNKTSNKTSKKQMNEKTCLILSSEQLTVKF